MPLRRRHEAFDHPDWLFELKYDGFRALADIQSGRTQLLSRNGHPFASFADLAQDIATDLKVNSRTVLNGEIVCLNWRGRPQFKELLFRRGTPCFYAFDLLMLDGKDQRRERLTDRKLELRRLLRSTPSESLLRYVDHVEHVGRALFERVCKMDLEGILAKKISAPYVTTREETTWFKILNPKYSQREGREELFERDRRKEPVPGWHTCAIACAETEAS